MLYPITFSIPKEKLCVSPHSHIKTKILSDLIPGDIRTYIYNTESEYYNEYKQSYFAITQKKGGWDCMRHYEIFANGCVPYFIDIENCPKNTTYLLPKELLIEANRLYENKFKNKNINELTPEDINEYDILQQKLFEYTKLYLTTDKMASYIMDKCNHSGNVSKILYLSGDTSPDYLRCLTLHGFKTLFGNNCHDFPIVPHIYKSNSINYMNLYGKGITYTNLLEPHLHNDHLDTTISEDIKNKYYDIVIFGSYHRGMPYYDLISEIYKPDEIILLCGEDIHCCNYNEFVIKGYHVFVREL
jgi:hypothetical protein